MDERVSNEAATLASMIIEATPGETAVEQEDARSEDGDRLLRGIRVVDEDADLCLRLMGPVSQLADLVTVARAAGRLRPGRDELAGAAYRLSVDALRGSVTLAVPRIRIDPPWAEMWAERILELRENVERRGGSLTVTTGPADVVGRAGTWGRLGRTARLMKGLKAQFDPGGVLSPGRLAFEED
jgi:FAD/FMN-containing dehydrogenase